MTFDDVPDIVLCCVSHRLVLWDLISFGAGIVIYVLFCSCF